MTKRELLLDYAKHFIGEPYHYGGDNPMNDFDCSGLVSEVCRALGIVGRQERLTAQGLFDVFTSRNWQGSIAPSNILFFGKSVLAISHVAICAEVDGLMYEAGGGTSQTDTVEKAAATDAFVRLRPIRADLVGTMDIIRD
jgi:cell wall-associated NlpC family hydrolase